jgi:23S rRNA (cytosine1962-C5)-methyltransferase
MFPQYIQPVAFSDYELIDSGNFEKLERFGQYVLARPEPQAIWHKALSEEDWKNKAHAWFRLNDNAHNKERGEWVLKKGMPQQWQVNYGYKEMKLSFRLGMTSFKHVGLFPEQAENWNFIYENIKSLQIAHPEVLNLFAYTGGASLAASAAGAKVTHVDSVKQVVTWSRENMELSGLANIRWIVEDALKFVQRQVRKGTKYQGIILDPPAYGRGADGEKWILEEHLALMVDCCNKLLDDKGFVVLNLYSMGFSPLVAQNILETSFVGVKNVQSGELFFEDTARHRLPLGIFARFNKNG